MPSNVKLLAGASGGEPTDANFKNVTLLLHGDGSNGAQNNTFIDSSTNNFTITRNGNTTQGSFSPYGSNWSNYFDGSGDYLTATSNAAFQFGTGDFTIEAWIYVTNYASTCAIFDTRTSGNEASGVIFYVRSDGKIELYRSAAVVTASTALSQNSWNHVAVTRSGSTCTLWLNGVSVGTATDSTNLTQQNSFIGAAYTGSANMMVGYISNLRVVKGTAVYTSAFTPSTTPLTAITNTSLLTCAYNRFRDGSTNNFTITRNGDVKVTNFAPFAPTSAYSTTTNGGSAYFDGSGDYITSPDNAAVQFGSGNFTIELWLNFNSTSGTQVPLVSRANTGVFAPYQLYLTGGVLYLYGSTNGSSWDIFNGLTVIPSVSANTWYHVVLVRSGSNFSTYSNGTRQANATVSGSLLLSSAPVTIGADASGANPYSGYISNLRMVKGTAVYDPSQTTLTVPTSPVTAITNTSLLTNFTNAAIFDNSMKNDLETVGNAQISTSVKKFGTGSIAFDGSGDTLIAPSNPDLALGSGPFTVEMWMYWNAVTNIGEFACFSITGSGGCFTFYYSGGTLQAVATGGAGVTSGSWTPSTGQWYHVAATRDASNVQRIFINGTLLASSTSTNNYGQNGFTMSYNSSFNGYIDEFRVTKGVARYTANFTPPTAPFPNK